jgi:hypothetical protein
MALLRALVAVGVVGWTPASGGLEAAPRPSAAPTGVDGCSRELSREAAEIVADIQRLASASSLVMSPSCPLHPGRSKYGRQEAYALELKFGQWQCAGPVPNGSNPASGRTTAQGKICGKAFKARRWLDAHFDRSHGEDLARVEPSCLADHCSMLGCPGVDEARGAVPGGGAYVARPPVEGLAARRGVPPLDRAACVAVLKACFPVIDAAPAAGEEEEENGGGSRLRRMPPPTLADTTIALRTVLGEHYCAQSVSAKVVARETRQRDETRNPYHLLSIAFVVVFTLTALLMWAAYGCEPVGEEETPLDRSIRLTSRRKVLEAAERAARIEEARRARSDAARHAGASTALRLRRMQLRDAPVADH